MGFSRQEYWSGLPFPSSKDIEDVIISRRHYFFNKVDPSLMLSAFLCLAPGRQQEGREEDQRLINLVGESLRLLGNTFVALSDLRCNLACAPPRHLHVVRPMSHYTTPMVLQQAAIPIQVDQGSLDAGG